MAVNRSSWRDEGVLESAVIRVIFFALLLAAAAILSLDLRELVNRAVDENSEQTMRIVFEPPTRTDQNRPYFPKALPVLKGAEAPMMPGVAKRPTPEMVGGRMAFYAGPDGNVSAIGRIEPGTARDFDDYLKTMGGSVKTIWLLSPGGSVTDAISIGESIRKQSLNTSVADNGYCASSCPLAFIGGITRSAGRGALIGVHQIYAIPQGNETWHDGIAAAQKISAECEEYLIKMGADAGAWIKAMQTPKERLYIFTPEELQSFKVTAPQVKT